MLDQIIINLGGPAAVAREMGLGDYSTVSCWVRRGSIPVRHWPGLIKLAKRRKVALDESALLQAHTMAKRVRA